jgi:hypothetical protein
MGIIVVKENLEINYGRRFTGKSDKIQQNGCVPAPYAGT